MSYGQQWLVIFDGYDQKLSVVNGGEVVWEFCGSHAVLTDLTAMQSWGYVFGSRRDVSRPWLFFQVPELARFSLHKKQTDSGLPVSPSYVIT